MQRIVGIEVLAVGAKTPSLSEVLDRTVRSVAKSDFGSDWDRTIGPQKSGNHGSFETKQLPKSFVATSASG